MDASASTTLAVDATLDEPGIVSLAHKIRKAADFSGKCPTFWAGGGFLGQKRLFRQGPVTGILAY